MNPVYFFCGYLYNFNVHFIFVHVALSCDEHLSMFIDLFVIMNQINKFVCELTFLPPMALR